MSLIEASTKEFGNITVFLHSLGSFCYRIEWYSKMTGTSISLARIKKGKYIVIRKWAAIRGLTDVSTEFDRANQAFIHLLNNVDVVKGKDDLIVAAKQHCVNLFAKSEGLKPISKPSLPKPRLQGAIGKQVVVKSRLGNSQIAQGMLLQLIGNQAEIQVNPEHIEAGQLRQKFYTKQVFIC
ncbi:hypothetical protein HC000_04375 [Pseudoalteromonas sp. MIP2626]|uniref:hypothetical protein n=1 Tax=Pseudoalteromonas sp. MIP2626 TaxID=2705464 RepID=UPI0015CC30A5|nr:hypothetical protein [Pseudoalteromonas sp. MIP2626]NYR11739.1 hypothetical protein [Pseudoalteromonas sp. MIP2626]